MVTTLVDKSRLGEKTTPVGEKRQDTSAIQGMIHIGGRNPSSVAIYRSTYTDLKPCERWDVCRMIFATSTA